MNTLTTTVAVEDGAARIIAELLQKFPKGRRIRVALTDEGDIQREVPSPEDFAARIAAARKAVPPCPWTTTDDAMRELREGEAD